MLVLWMAKVATALALAATRQTSGGGHTRVRARDSGLISDTPDYFFATVLVLMSKDSPSCRVCQGVVDFHAGLFAS